MEVIMMMVMTMMIVPRRTPSELICVEPKSLSHKQHTAAALKSHSGLGDDHIGFVPA